MQVRKKYKEIERERLMNFIKENPYPDKSTTTLHKRGGKTALQQHYYTLLTVLRDLIDQRGLDRDTIIFVFYNIRTIVSQHWDEIGKDDEQWRH